VTTALADTGSPGWKELVQQLASLDDQRKEDTITLQDYRSQERLLVERVEALPEASQRLGWVSESHRLAWNTLTAHQKAGICMLPEDGPSQAVAHVLAVFSEVHAMGPDVVKVWTAWEPEQRFQVILLPSSDRKRLLKQQVEAAAILSTMNRTLEVQQARVDESWRQADEAKRSVSTGLRQLRYEISVAR
jgi:hypothetical protein